MQLGGQPEAQGGLVWAPGFDWRRERVPAEAVALVEAKQAAHSWRSMHARAKARVAQRWGQWRAAERQLADARRQIAQLAGRVRELEQENAGLRQRQQELLKTPFGKRSEKRQGGSADGPGSAGTSQGPQRSRGGQPGASAHARVARAGLPVREEWHEPEAVQRQCLDCGRPYRRNGEAVSDRIEIEVKAHVRRIRRPRYRAACECARRPGQAVPEVLAPLEPTLFRGSGYGLSVWVAFLMQVDWQRHPARAFEREWAEFGVRLPAATLLGHVPDFLTWFEPLAEAIGVHQQQARVVHGDETSWVVHVRAEADANPRCWLWACLSRDAVLFRVDPSRSAAAAGQLFGALGRDRRVVLVCDRYAAYVKLAREHPGQFELAVCWVHVRRDFVTLGRKRPDLQAWVEGIVARIGKLYQRNAERLAAWDPEGCPQGQSEQFQAAQERLEAEFEALFEQAGKEQRALSAAAGKPPGGGPPDPRLGPLQSLLKHRKGLTVFVAKPFVAMDNNPVERALRRPVIGRKLSFGSHSENGAALQGALLSVCATLDLAGLDLRRWLEAFLRECAGLGPQAVVVDPQAWLPWGLPAARLRELQAQGRRSRHGPAP